MLPIVGADWAAAERMANRCACSPFCAAAGRRACWHWTRTVDACIASFALRRRWRSSRSHSGTSLGTPS
eukprot:1176550-Prymnesium_polylepis.1